MNSMRRYKICICSVILGELESFRNYKGLSIIFSKILDAILSFTKMRIFLIPLSIAFSNPKVLGFLFLRKITFSTWRLKCELLHELEKIVGNLLDMLRKLYMNGTVVYSRKFLAFLRLNKFLGNLCFSEQIFYENSFWVPLFKKYLSANS